MDRIHFAKGEMYETSNPKIEPRERYKRKMCRTDARRRRIGRADRAR